MSVRLNLRVPEDLMDRIDEQVDDRSFMDRSEYIRQVIRKDLGDA
jgi:Arc/MetJ-type ribon-helix-helix transcriptional regulator